MLVRLTKTGKVIQATAERAGRLVASGRAQYLAPETATLRAPERAVMPSLKGLRR